MMPRCAAGQQRQCADHQSALLSLAQSLGGVRHMAANRGDEFARIGPTDDVQKKQQHKATNWQTE
jgi:hypothetical protein